MPQPLEIAVRTRRKARCDEEQQGRHNERDASNERRHVRECVESSMYHRGGATASSTLALSGEHVPDYRETFAREMVPEKSIAALPLDGKAA